MKVSRQVMGSWTMQEARLISRWTVRMERKPSYSTSSMGQVLSYQHGNSIRFMQYANLEIWDDTSDFDWLLFSLECQWESPLSKPSSGRLNLANSTSKYALRSSAREALLRLPDLDPIAAGAQPR